MGNSTIIEFNHDRWDEIFSTEETQKEFLQQLREQFACAKHTGKSIKGGYVVAFFNRYDKINDVWCKFKNYCFK